MLLSAFGRREMVDALELGQFPQIPMKAVQLHLNQGDFIALGIMNACLILTLRQIKRAKSFILIESACINNGFI